MAAIFTYERVNLAMDCVYLVRYGGKMVTIRSRPFEPERMSTDIAWIQIREEITPEEAYRKWFEIQRRISRLLQQ